MNVYRVTYGSGATIDVELTGSHVPPPIVLEEAKRTIPLTEEISEYVPAFITRDPGTPAERVVWRRLDANRSERIVELENGTAEDDRAVRELRI